MLSWVTSVSLSSTNVSVCFLTRALLSFYPPSKNSFLSFLAGLISWFMDLFDLLLRFVAAETLSWLDATSLALSFTCSWIVCTRKCCCFSCLVGSLYCTCTKLVLDVYRLRKNGDLFSYVLADRTIKGLYERRKSEIPSLWLSLRVKKTSIWVYRICLNLSSFSYYALSVSYTSASRSRRSSISSVFFLSIACWPMRVSSSTPSL